MTHLLLFQLDDCQDLTNLFKLCTAGLNTSPSAPIKMSHQSQTLHRRNIHLKSKNDFFSSCSRACVAHRTVSEGGEFPQLLTKYVGFRVVSLKLILCCPWSFSLTGSSLHAAVCALSP